MSHQEVDSVGVRLPIRVRVGGALLPGTIHAVSRRGLFLHTDQVVTVGDAAQLIFYTTPFAALVVQGRVSWLEPGGGCGILFSVMPAFAATMLSSLIMPSLPGRELAAAS